LSSIRLENVIIWTSKALAETIFGAALGHISARARNIMTMLLQKVGRMTVAFWARELAACGSLMAAVVFVRFVTRPALAIEALEVVPMQIPLRALVTCTTSFHSATMEIII
jgi:hypothetical protein